MLHTALDKGLSGLLDLFFPPYCVACGKNGAWLCAACVQQARMLRAPLCAHCGVPLRSARQCPLCDASSSHLSGLRSLTWHRYPLREAVHALKYNGARVLAEPLADLLAAYWQENPLPASLLVPVPLHSARLRQRGYNQSALLARALAKRIALPVSSQALQRGRATVSQVGLSREQRWSNVWGAFQSLGDEVTGRAILLIDDVCTTGATLEACAHALLKGGASQVWALTLTRAMLTRREIYGSAAASLPIT